MAKRGRPRIRTREHKATIRCEPKVWRFLKRRAAENRRSINAELNAIVAGYMSRQRSGD